MKRAALRCSLALLCLSPIFARGQGLRPDADFVSKKIAAAGDLFVLSGSGRSPDGGFYLQGGGAITKLDKDGAALWRVAIAPGLLASDGLAIDGSGAVYLGFTDILNRQAGVAKYGSSGTLLKTLIFPYSTLPMPGPFAPAMLGITGGNSGYIYAAVAHTDPLTMMPMLSVQKLDTNLDVAGETTIFPYLSGGFWGGFDMDASGGLYLLYYSLSDNSYAYRRYGSNLNLSAYSLLPDYKLVPASGVAIPAGGMYVSIDNLDALPVPDTDLLNLSSGGTQVWKKTFPGVAHLAVLVVDSAGNVYMAGSSASAPQIEKLSHADGSMVWTAAIDGAYSAQPFYVDELDRVYVIQDMSDGIYLARYLQGKASGYSLSRVEKTNNQIVPVNTLSAPLESLVTGKSGPVSGAGLDFAVSGYPAGATGQELSRQSGTTGADGLAGVQLKLGNIPAEYSVTATCPSCEVSANAVTFTCCGKLITDEFRQDDSRWNTRILGSNPPANTIGAVGCALTSAANMLNFYSPNNRTNPERLNQNMITRHVYNLNDDVQWWRVPELQDNQIRHVGALGTPTTSLVDIRARINTQLNASLPVIMRGVRPPDSNGRIRTHFMLIIGKCGENYIVADPSAGVRQYSVDDPQLTLNEIQIYELR